MNPGRDLVHHMHSSDSRADEVTMSMIKDASTGVDSFTLDVRASATRAESIRILGVTTGTLQLKPTFLEGSPAHGGPLGLILALRRDAAFTSPLPMWAWWIETETERILIDAGGRSGMQGGVYRLRARGQDGRVVQSAGKLLIVR